LPRHPLTLLAAAAALLAAPAFAAEGVLEINQTCATQTGCFEGDKAGFPVTITDAAAAKSFRLTSDLVVPSELITAVSIDSNLVRIDLGGFAVRGPVTCTGTPLVCSPTGPGNGIAVTSPAREAVEVRNGAVSGMGGRGVSVGVAGVVENVRATRNGSRGIQAGSGGVVRGSTASFNGGQGILVAVGAQIVGSVVEHNGGEGINANSSAVVMIGNTAQDNGATGILCGSAAILKNNTSSFNGSHGIATGSSAMLSENTVLQNFDDGIRCTDRCNISGNSVSFNGDAVGDEGIRCGSACTVRGNMVSVTFGKGAALDLGATSAYRENLVDAAGAGSVVGGVNRGDNLCTGTAAVLASCP